jgi:tetratricopeptide (TPR) repeat protein
VNLLQTPHFRLSEIAMNERPPLDATVDNPPSDDNLDAGLAAAFGPGSSQWMTVDGSVLHALSASMPSVPRILLRDPDSFGGSPIVRPSSDEMPDKQYRTARLQLHGEIARGGMGAVLKGRDVDLGRDVAVKVLLETHQGKMEMLQRFVEEAQIAGQLQHPGITPVYELGQFADKRPYFTMKLVKGKTLAMLLATRKSPEEERTRYVGIFAQVCQTLAYAHARGVIHRDLKPSNVMVGAFGEVQVMDWGLAKVLKEGGVADELRSREREHAEVSVIRTQRSEGSSSPLGDSETQAGTVLGTPAYMAPEQARGDVNLVDERADVFGLGAILCEILTGKPPYVGKGAELQYKARTAKLEEAFARLDRCGADAELIALTRHCLAAELWERPSHAGEVAERVMAYQQAVAERLRQAELAETEARARAAEESKTRVEAEARLGAERRARRMTLGLAAAVLVALTLAGGGGLWYQQQAAEKRAEAARREVELREAVAAALDKVTDLRQRARWEEARAVLEQVRQRLGPSSPEDLQIEVTQAEKDLTLVDRLDTARLKASVVVDGHFDHASAIGEYAAAFREGGLGDETEAAEVVAERIRASAVREPLVAAVDDWAGRVKEPERRSWLLAVARAADPDPWRDRFRDAKVWRDRVALERLAREAKVSELSPQVLTVLGVLLTNSGADAVTLLTAALRRDPSDFWLHFQLAHALDDAKRWDDAIGYYRAGLALRPRSSAVYNNLGNALRETGRVDEAIAEYKMAIEIDPKDTLAHNNLGLALSDKGRVDEAIAEYKKAIEIDPKLAKAHTNLGLALRNKGRVDEAIAEFKKAIEIDPKLAMAHSNLGLALHNKGRVDEAIAEYKKAIEIGPKDANAHTNLGIALRAKGRVDEAIDEYKKAIELDPKLVMAHYNLGIALSDKGRVDEAIDEYKKAIEIDPKLATAHNNLGSALAAKGHVDEAIAEYKKAIEIDLKYAPAHTNLGVALRDKGHVDEAIAESKKAIELDPKYAEAHCNLGLILSREGRFAEAATVLKRGHELGSRRPGWRYPSAQWLRIAEQNAALAAKLPALLRNEYRPRDNAERLGLAQVCMSTKHYAAATRLYTDAFAAEPMQVDDLKTQHRYNAACVAALAGCGRGEDAKQLDDKERTRWRKQALDWLQADLSAHGKLVDGGKSADRTMVQQRLQHWQRDSDLSGLRDKGAVAKLPADERQACEKLWADVAALLEKTQTKK